MIRRVALCGGAGGFLLSKAIEVGADAFLTGEMRYHDYFGHEGDLLIAEMGHYEIVEYGTGLIGWFRKLFDIRKRVNNDLFRQCGNHKAVG